MPAGNQRVLAGGIVFTAAVAIYTTVYLPFYSTDIEELRKKANNRPPSAPRSMWGNLDREIKERKEDK